MAASGKHNNLILLLRHMMVFSILLALLVVGGDFVHEFGSRGDLIVFKREKTLSAIRGTPAEHSSVGIFLCS